MVLKLLKPSPQGLAGMREFLKEVSIKNKDPGREIAKTVFEAASEVKALDSVVLDVRGKASFTDYLFITTATNNRQACAIADRVRESVSAKLHRNPLGVEGVKNAMWILLDYGDMVCHIFLKETRSFYQLEHLWHDAKEVRVKAGETEKLTNRAVA